jgi:chromosome segregation ATPase
MGDFMSTSFLPGFRRGACSLAALILLAGAAASAGAQTPQGQGTGQSMEERLRNQLRITTTQLQDAQNELATLKAGKGGAAPGAPAAPSDIEALKKDLARSQAQLAEERRQRGKSEASEAALKQATGQVAQYKASYDQLLKLARTSEAERQRLSTEASFKQQAVAQCEAKNAALYAQGQEILHAYENVDVGTVLSSREPFATKSRVKYEQIAQEYGDKLYEGRFDERSVAVPTAAAPAMPAAPKPGDPNALSVSPR